MKAIVYTEYGSPDVLHLKEVEKPTPKDNEVLIRVHASTVTTGDCNVRGFVFVPGGFKLLARLMFGIRKPRKNILGVEFAGEIETVGKDVKRFKKGDQVFGLSGTRLGAYAEYVCMPEDVGMVIKPPHIPYEEAAAVPNGALTAFTFLKTRANIQRGQKVLIYGASGSVGTFAVQLARHFGAEVTGVCSSRNFDMVKSLGADKLIDYTREDFTKNGQTYDIIFDTVGKTSFAGCKSSLKPKGLYLSAAGGPGMLFQAGWTSLTGGKKVLAGPSSESQEHLEVIRDLLAEGQIKPFIDKCYPFEEIVEAHRYVDTARKRGNVVITVMAE
ncbi:MAG: NAD(P)-dependent alcohol dehydrogenase [Anaerolineae bacterium]|nr:NAD(P)-dependent alcohol dehydrogenase [Anaerolineae bacterium]